VEYWHPRTHSGNRVPCPLLRRRYGLLQ